MIPVRDEPDDGGSNAMNARDRAQPVLEVDDLRTEFHLRHANVKAVDGVSFSVRAGECVGLVGESGCGKSTTGLSVMKLLPGAGHVTGGAIRLEGRDLVPLSEEQMRKVRGDDVAMIFQDPMTSPARTEKETPSTALTLA